MHERTHEGRAFRLLTLLDEYTRECLAIEVQRQMNHQDVLDRLAELFVHRGVPEYIRSDNVLTAESRPGRRHRNPECFLQSQATSNVVLDPVAFHG